MHNANMNLDMPYTKEELASKLSELLGSVVQFSYLAQGYHWNVKGPEFYQFHEFFEEIYEDAFESVDPLAENIRKLGYPAPFALEDFLALSCLDVRPVTEDPIDMSRSLYDANKRLVEKYMYAFKSAEACNQQGVADFLAGRIDMHQKWHWMLETTVGEDATQVKVIEVGGQ